MTINVYVHKIVKGGNLQQSKYSIFCFVIAEGSANALPVFISILAHIFVPTSLHNMNILLRSLINDTL